MVHLPIWASEQSGSSAFDGMCDIKPLRHDLLFNIILFQFSISPAFLSLDQLGPCFKKSLRLYILPWCTVQFAAFQRRKCIWVSNRGDWTFHCSGPSIRVPFKGSKTEPGACWLVPFSSPAFCDKYNIFSGSIYFMANVWRAMNTKLLIGLGKFVPRS